MSTALTSRGHWFDPSRAHHQNPLNKKSNCKGSNSLQVRKISSCHTYVTARGSAWLRFRKRGEKYQVQVRRSGHRGIARSFHHRKDALAWGSAGRQIRTATGRVPKSKPSVATVC